MPGYVAPQTWGSGERYIAQREILAGKLLFDEGIQACNNSAKKDFIKLFKAGTAAAGAGTAGAGTAAAAAAAAAGAGGPVTPTKVFRKPPVDDTMAKAEAEAFGNGSKPPAKKKQQTILSAFSIDTACFMDDRLARDMRAARRSKTNNKT
jgi:hypothetical protein